MGFLLIRVVRKSLIITIIKNDMVDLHTHILPGIDDGAQTREEALNMTESLYVQRVSIAVCTPHFDPMKISLADFLSKREEAIRQMNPSRIKLISGSEVALNDYLFHYPDLSQLCIGTTKYILIELPFVKKWDQKLFDQIDHLSKYYNLTPIIAHVERYPAIKKSKKNLKRLIDTGCLLQLNTSSIINKKLWHQAADYIKQGYIDVISSDCHNMTSRPPVITEAYAIIKNKLGTEYYDKFIKNGESIIKGLELREKTEFVIS